MIPVGIKMADDELMTAWLKMLADANGLDFKSFCEGHLGIFTKYTPPANLLYPKLLEQNCARHADMAHFPDLFTAVEQHTPFYASAWLATSYGNASRIMEISLHDVRPTTDLAMIEGGYRFCPECMKEDMALHGRCIVHVQHQIHGVKVCWKHGAPLRNDHGPLTDDVSEREMRIAAHAKRFYLDPLPGARAQAIAAIRQHMQPGRNVHTLAEEAASSGWLDEAEKKQVDKVIGKFADMRSMPSVVRILAYLYPDIEDIYRVESVLPPAPVSTEEFELLDTRHCIGKYRCRACGHEFYRHEHAVASGMTCPSCHNGLDSDAEMARLLSRYRDGQYELQPQRTASGHMWMIHKPCGKRIVTNHMFWLYDDGQCRYCKTRPAQEWERAFDGSPFYVKEVLPMIHRSRDMVLVCRKCGKEITVHCSPRYLRGDISDVRCSVCNPDEKNDLHIKRERKKMTGMRLVAPTGVGATLVRYESKEHVLVRFDNGAERWMYWSSFLRSAEPHKKGITIREFHIGEKGIMKNGEECTIVEYDDCKHLVVEFSDGVRAAGNYKQFKARAIRHP